VVVISLVIGGIVIMNIMLMAVAERTREIGLRKSLGARRRDVLRQFLAESTAIATVGAGFGIVAGIGLTMLIGQDLSTPAACHRCRSCSASSWARASGSRRRISREPGAARLDPITALRQE